MKIKTTYTNYTYVSLLRGINVGGKNIIKMDKLKQCFVDMGFFDVKTYIQSGNIIFKTKDSDKLKLTKKIDKQLLKTFSSEIRTVIFSINELMEIIENAPKNFGTEPEKFRYDVCFLMPPITVDKIISTVPLREGIDYIETGKNTIYISRLVSELSKSYMQKIIKTPIYKNITVRNWNTTTKLLKLACNSN